MKASINRNAASVMLKRLRESDPRPGKKLCGLKRNALLNQYFGERTPVSLVFLLVLAATVCAGGSTVVTDPGSF
jgi:hypothetical protein